MHVILSVVLAVAYRLETPDMLRDRADAAVRAGYTLTSKEVELLPFQEEVTSALLAGKFDKLEKMATSLRKPGQVVTGNWPKLIHFYEFLAPDSRTVEWEALEARRVKLEEWVAKQPHSVTAKIALAELRSSYGWLARGNHYGVSEEGRREYRSKLEEARKLLLQARSMEPKDPQAYAYLIISVKNLGGTSEEVETYLREGAAVDRDYQPLYVFTANHYRPEWSGKPEKLGAFAERAASMVSPKQRDAIYAQIMWATIRPDPVTVKSYSLDWQRVRAGLDSLLAASPKSSLIHHLYGWAACGFGDKGAAATMFEQVRYGLDPDSEDIWGSTRIMFDGCRRWAAGIVPVVRAVKTNSWCNSQSYLRPAADGLTLCQDLRPSTESLDFVIELSAVGLPRDAVGPSIRFVPDPGETFVHCFVRHATMPLVAGAEGRCSLSSTGRASAFAAP